MRPKNYYQNLKSVCLRRQNLVLLLGAYFTALNFYFPETCRTMSLAYISKPVLYSSRYCFMLKMVSSAHERNADISQPKAHCWLPLLVCVFSGMKAAWWTGWGRLMSPLVCPLQTSAVNFWMAERMKYLICCWLSLFSNDISPPFLLEWLRA